MHMINKGRVRWLSKGDAVGQDGHYATVFVPSVRAQAAGFGMAFDLLLGYAVAHEVGHCLLGPGHSNAATFLLNFFDEVRRRVPSGE
jgi:hypothetical protein